MAHRNQFSLLHALGLLTAVAFFMGIVVLPEPLRSLAAYGLHVSLIAIAVAAVVFGQRLVRAFWIGWLVPLVSANFLGFGRYYNDYGPFDGPFGGHGLVVLSMIVFSAICGALSYATARWVSVPATKAAASETPRVG